MKKLKQWLRKWLGIEAYEVFNNGIHASNQRHIDNIEIRVDKRLAELDELTRIDADVGVRGANTIIVSGVYQGKAYVRFYDVSNQYFTDMVQRLREENRTHLIRNVDAPPQIRGFWEL